MGIAGRTQSEDGLTFTEEPVSKVIVDIVTSAVKEAFGVTAYGVDVTGTGGTLVNVCMVQTHTHTHMLG